MRTLQNLESFFIAFLFVLVTSCGDDEDEGVGDPVKQHSAYTIESSLNVQSNFGDSGLGKLLNMLRDMSDDDDDPGKFVVQQILEKLPSPLQWAAKPFESKLGQEVNQAIYSVVPTAADEAKSIADGLSKAARQFNVASRLDVGIDAKDRFTGTHEIKRLIYSFKEKRLELSRSELGDKASPAVRIPIHLDGAVLTIDRHDLQLPIGTVLKKVLNDLIIAGVVKECADLWALISRWFACVTIASKMAESIGGGEQILAVCISQSQNISDKLIAELIKLDEQGRLRLNGHAEARDDGIAYQGNGWSGSYKISKDVEAPIDPQNNPFSAQKIEITQYK